MKVFNTDVLIIGAGPAGMAAALQLTQMGIQDIIIVDRDTQAGGVPRLCNHLGFGMRDIHRVLSGPSYAESYLKKIKNSSIQLLTETTVTEWIDEKKIKITSPKGIHTIDAKAILLATGCRERPRSARLIPGYRPQGIYNTGSLQDYVHGYKEEVGKSAVIIGAELVSYSAIHTLSKAGCKIKLMATEFDKHQIYMPYLPFKWWSSGLLPKIPLKKNSIVTNIYGKQRVTGIDLVNKKTGKKKHIACDTVVFTGDWIPDHEMARLGTIEIDDKTKGPVVDAQLRTSKEGIFAAGNLLRGSEPGDVAALEGRHAAQSIEYYLKNGGWYKDRIKIIVTEPLKWISPNSVDLGSSGLPMNRFLFRVNDFIKNKTFIVRQGETVLYRKKYSTIGPNYSRKIDAQWINNINSTEPISISLE